MAKAKKKSTVPKSFTHKGRAANCECLKMPGARCPDCNHLLTGKIMKIQADLGHTPHSETICVVCGSHISDEKRPRELRLEVHDSKQDNSTKT